MREGNKINKVGKSQNQQKGDNQNKKHECKTELCHYKSMLLAHYFSKPFYKTRAKVDNIHQLIT